jgi:L-erythro-3,5-diaminohexanoate dehydrogenase
VAVLGATGALGWFALAAARRAGAGRTAGLVTGPAEAARLDGTDLADVVATVDVRDPVALSTAVSDALGGPADVVVVCAGPGTEAAAVLSAAPAGTVLFGAAETAFTTARDAADALAGDVTLVIGGGYLAGQADFALHLLRSTEGIGSLLGVAVAHETSVAGAAPA